MILSTRCWFDGIKPVCPNTTLSKSTVLPSSPFLSFPSSLPSYMPLCRGQTIPNSSETTTCRPTIRPNADLSNLTGSFMPFFRAHANKGTKRREPYLFPPDIQSKIKDAIRLRYRLLPLWYTAFQQCSVTGMPLMR